MTKVYFVRHAQPEHEWKALIDAGYKVKDVEDFENSVNDEIM